MLEDLNFLHSGLEETKPAIHLIFMDYHTMGSIKDYLEKAFNVEVKSFSDSVEYWQNFESPQLIISDDSLLIEKLKSKNKTILVTEKVSSKDYVSLSRPISFDRLKTLVENILATTLDAPVSFKGLVGASVLMENIFTQIRNNCTGEKPILILGPAGSGKSSIASAIKQTLGISTQHIINCGLLSPDCLENEMFGHSDGKLSKGGMVFFEDIDKLPLLSQAKLTKFLKYESSNPVIIVASTEKDLIDLANSGDFRKDLLNLFGLQLTIPPLASREEDIELLINFFNKKYAGIHGCLEVRFDESALIFLKEYEWPLNVKELENLIEKLVILHTGGLIDLTLLGDNFFKGSIEGSVPFELPEMGIDLRQLLRDIEGSLIKQALEKTGGNKNRASKLLQINRTTLVEKLKKRKRESNNQVT